MASQPTKAVRLVNVVPLKTKIKVEQLSDDEDVVSCKICSKGFASDMALRNHARMEHFEIFAEGDPSAWTAPAEPQEATQPKTRKLQQIKMPLPIKVKENPEEVKLKTEEILSSMTAGNLMSLASNDVSYIIIKSDESFPEEPKKKRVRVMKVDHTGKETTKKKEPEPITYRMCAVHPHGAHRNLRCGGTDRVEEILSSMTAGNLMSLASNDVSYIIIKSDESFPEEPKKKRVRVMKVDHTGKETTKKKEPEPITGPFECVQPSNQVADGVCHQIFFSCCEYSSHYRDEHTRRRKGLRCQVCEKPLLQQDEGKMPYTCEVCGAGFMASKELSEHTSIAHVKLKPFQCTVCFKRFTQQGGVQQHMRMHTGDRPFPCTFCQKSFTQKSGLDQHLRIHTKVKPYRCVICAKTFCQSVHLKQHMRTHTNVSPFQCGICQKRFKQSSHLNYHLRNHNPGNMTDDQKQKYEELVGMMSKEVVQVEIPESEETVETMETTEITEITDDMEQVIAEQSIQVVQNETGDEYILSDDGQTWSVQLVEK